MAIDAGKLAAYANQGKAGGGGPPPTDEDYDDTGLEDQASEPAGDDDDDMQEGGAGRFGALIPLLEEFADDIEDSCANIDADALENPDADMSPEDQQILQQDVASLDKKLMEAMKASFGGGITLEEAQNLADHLADEKMITDPDKVAGWLYRVADIVAGQAGGGNEGEEEGDEGEPSDEDDEEGGEY